VILHLDQRTQAGHSLLLDAFREFQRDRSGRLALVHQGPGVESLDAYFVAGALAEEGVDAAGFLNLALARQWLLEKGRAETAP
jgi:NAD(P)H-hydrate repair Nnr-like enzyme with NAD(P)H-hydrate epimerase domain